MDTKFFLGIGLAIVLVFCSAAVYNGFTRLPTAAAIPEDRETLYQVSTIDALMQGVFDGVQPISELKKHGDFGIGTFDALEGEMIVLDGRVYQAKSDGRIYAVMDNATTPFATVTYFERDVNITTGQPMNFSVFSTTMSARLPSQNMVYGVRMHGTFPHMKVRAIPAQQKPYPTLTDAGKNQSVYRYTDVTGTVVGFYTPVFFKGLNVAGYHLHFISDDQQYGGHILDFTVPANVTVDYDITPVFEMSLPTSGAFTGVDLSQDLSEELAQVES
ncbi:MAG: acetolactate decarboxylase [Methanoregula sp.]|jgi:acetolactate decarboxylase|nr:acetolactate decarboxylase [Methanoregula sp.]